MYNIPTSFGVEASSSWNPKHKGVHLQTQRARAPYHNYKMYMQTPEKKSTDTHHMD
jgi:hypothetical protein